MKKLLLFLLFALPLAAVTVSDTIYLADNSVPPSGTLTISWPSYTSSAGRTVAKGSRTYTITNGVVSLTLDPSTTATPAFTYTVRYNFIGVNYTEYWAVPNVSPSTIRDVRTGTPVPPSPLLLLSQINTNGWVKGDMLVFTGSALTRLAVGTNDYILKADSAQTEGIKWAASGAGAGDVVGPSSSTANKIVLMDGTTGKLIKEASSTGVLTGTAGVIGVVAGTATDCVLVNGTSGACGTGTTYAAGPSGGIVIDTAPAPDEIDIDTTVVPRKASTETVSGAWTFSNTSTVLPTNTVLYATVTVSNAELLDLKDTPKTLVAAPGAGKILEFLSAMVILDYTAPGFTETADNMVIRYTGTTGAIVSETIETTGFIDQTADTITNAIAKADAIVAAASGVNQVLVLHNTGGDEFGGAGGSTLIVKIAYRVHTTGL